MKRDFTFTSSELFLNFKLNIVANILKSNDENTYVEFSSDYEDLIIEYTKNVLEVRTKDDDNNLLYLLASNIFRYSADVKIYLANNIDMTLNLESYKLTCIVDENLKELNFKFNDGDVKINSEIKQLDIKMNSGDLAINNFIDDCHIKGNSIRFISSIDSSGSITNSQIKHLDLKINSGSVVLNHYIDNCNIKGNSIIFENKSHVGHLMFKSNSSTLNLNASQYTEQWDIKTNSGLIELSKNDFVGSINGQGDSSKGIINIKSHSRINILL